MLSVLQRTIKYTSSAEIISFLLCLFWLLVVVVGCCCSGSSFFYILEAICAIFQPKLCFLMFCSCHMVEMLVNNIGFPTPTPPTNSASTKKTGLCQCGKNMFQLLLLLFLVVVVAEMAF